MKEHVWINSRNKKLSAMIHHPSNDVDPPIVIICHGFTGEKIGGSQFYLNIANSIETAGFAVLRFDYAGSGESEGTFAVDTTITGWKTDLQNTINYIKEDSIYKKSKIFILGHSLGGSIALLHEDPERLISGRIGVAPEILPEENYRNKILGPELWSASKNGQTISHFFGKSYSLEPYFVQDILEHHHNTLEASKAYNCPVLLIHGTEDDAVSADFSKLFYEQYSGPKTLTLIDNADHGFSRHLTELKENILSFISNNS